MKILSIVWALLCAISLQAQENYTISGYITDGTSGETLIGATAYITQLEKGAISNEYGFYSLFLSEGDYTIHYSYLGFDDKAVAISLNRNINMDI